MIASDILEAARRTREATEELADSLIVLESLLEGIEEGED
jgi:hypothetical protein